MQIRRLICDHIIGLNYAKDVGLVLLQQKLATLDIPDQHGDASTPIGHVDWDLKSIVLQGFAIPKSEIKLLPNQGLRLGM